jgi:ankyrin repeat protein
MADAATRERHEKFRRISAAFAGGDLAELRASLGSTDGFPNDPLPLDVFGPAGTVLEYAIYHSPLPLVRALLEAGARPCPDMHEHAGFPPLLAALTCVRTQSGSRARPDVHELLQLLLAFGADPNQRGLNDWTALHMAVAEGSLDSVRQLLDAGADPALRTRIDEYETAREMAERAGKTEIAAVLGAGEGGRQA